MKPSIILDSNIIIYSVVPEYHFLISQIARYRLHTSGISKVEVLGFSGLSDEDKADFVRYFQRIELFQVTNAVLEKAIELRQQKKMSLGDSIIAGTAVIEGIPIMTRNVKDFEWIDGVEVVNPFDSF